MYQEKIINPPSGYLTFALSIALLGASIFCFVSEIFLWGGILLAIDVFLIFPGFLIINPNQSMVLTLFGKYIGTVKADGFFWVNPLTTKRRLSLKANNLTGNS